MDALISMPTLITRMGLPLDPDDVSPQLKLAVSAAQLHIESLLATKLIKAAYTDRFYLDSFANSGIRPNGFFHLVLSNGFISADPAPVISFADTKFAEDWSVLDADADEGYSLDSEKGWLQVNEFYETKYVKAEYTAGYDPGDDLPEWLSECIYTLVPVIFEFGSVAIAQKGEAPAASLAMNHVATVCGMNRRRIHGIVIRSL